MDSIKDKKDYLVIAGLSFFFLITAQTFWSTIHGDGAVYAKLIKAFGTAGFFSNSLPHWSITEGFAEHPYLFFMYSAVFAKIFGYSDWAIKLPNYFIGILSVWTVYRIALYRIADKSTAFAVGIISGYVLLINSGYLHQISQPTLDPAAQFLALAAVSCSIFFKRNFLSGILLGFAFLTKGLELLPNFGALLLVLAVFEYKNLKSLLAEYAKLTGGLILILFIWLVYDQLLLSGEWLQTYWQRQFVNRFFMKSNMQSVFNFNYLNTFISLYFVELIVLTLGIFKSKLWPRKHDKYFYYFIFYAVLNIAAFLIIKKDSSQHMTGVMLFGSVIIAEYVYEIGSYFKINISTVKKTAIFILMLSFVYWGWFIFNRNNNPDVWTKLKILAFQINNEQQSLPVVIEDTGSEYYGVFYTSSWYINTKPVYSYSEATQLLSDQEVYLVKLLGDGKFSYSKTNYNSANTK